MINKLSKKYLQVLNNRKISNDVISEGSSDISIEPVVQFKERKILYDTASL